jgi:hypothetical protein
MQGWKPPVSVWHWVGGWRQCGWRAVAVGQEEGEEEGDVWSWRNAFGGAKRTQPLVSLVVQMQ